MLLIGCVFSRSYLLQGKAIASCQATSNNFLWISFLRVITPCLVWIDSLDSFALELTIHFPYLLLNLACLFMFDVEGKKLFFCHTETHTWIIFFLFFPRSYVFTLITFLFPPYWNICAFPALTGEISKWEIIWNNSKKKKRLGLFTAQDVKLYCSFCCCSDTVTTRFFLCFVFFLKMDAVLLWCGW